MQPITNEIKLSEMGNYEKLPKFPANDKAFVVEITKDLTNNKKIIEQNGDKPKYVFVLSDGLHEATVSLFKNNQNGKPSKMTTYIISKIAQSNGLDYSSNWDIEGCLVPCVTEKGNNGVYIVPIWQHLAKKCFEAKTPEEIEELENQEISFHNLIVKKINAMNAIDEVIEQPAPVAQPVIEQKDKPIAQPTSVQPVQENNVLKTETDLPWTN